MKGGGAGVATQLESNHVNAGGGFGRVVQSTRLMVEGKTTRSVGKPRDPSSEPSKYIAGGKFFPTTGNFFPNVLV